MNNITLTEDEKDLSNELVKFSLQFCTACYFGSPSDKEVKVNNGTVTLIEYKNVKYGITNFHVIEAFRQRLEEEPELELYIGNALINLEGLVRDEDEKLDLCILNLDDYDEEEFRSNGNIPTTFYPIQELSKINVSKGDFILFGGYPGVWRERPEVNHLIFDSLSTGSMEVSEVTERNIRCEFSLEGCHITLSEHHNSIPNNFGGLSGGPVFLNRTLPSGINIFEFVGIIYEYMELSNSIMIRPSSFIDENMTLKKINFQ
ncbi:hypothetical protein QT397_04125 [Microbulbifer sp. MKSA007]|nr:hypothetical protein QT397_04125 [Microbulbifer sp. MKSA007]